MSRMRRSRRTCASRAALKMPRPQMRSGCRLQKRQPLSSAQPGKLLFSRKNTIVTDAMLQRGRYCSRRGARVDGRNGCG